MDSNGRAVTFNDEQVAEKVVDESDIDEESTCTDLDTDSVQIQLTRHNLAIVWRKMSVFMLKEITKAYRNSMRGRKARLDKDEEL